MAEPTVKHPAIDQLLTAMIGKSRGQTIRGSKCMTCDNPDLCWRDPLSRKEYAISGMCQRCQDGVFQ